MGSPYDPVAWRRTLRNLKVGKFRSTGECEDPGPSATDRGQGPEFVHPFDEAIAQVEKMIEFGLAKQEVTLPPEVLAQLQRIEDMLTKIETSTHVCPDCGERNCSYE